MTDKFPFKPDRDEQETAQETQPSIEEVFDELPVDESIVVKSQDDIGAKAQII